MADEEKENVKKMTESRMTDEEIENIKKIAESCIKDNMLIFKALSKI